MASGTYATITLADALNDMGSRLYDPNHVRWPEVELVHYIQQALRTYNSLTNHFRAEDSFQSASPEAFYDLPTVLPTLREQTYTVQEAVDQIAYMLMEPAPIGGAWVGTLQYSLNDILLALQDARDTFLLETGVVQTHSTLAVTAPADGIVDIDEAIINLRRLAWQTANGIITILRRDDQWGVTNYRPNWQTSSSRPPTAYSISTQPPLQVQLAPITTVDGTLDLLTINRGSAITNLLGTQSLGVPNDWAWVVIFGALAQLLQRDGLAIDPGRASYADQRWQHGLKMARAAAVVMSARIQGTQVNIGSVADADFYSASWQMVPGNSSRILTAGQTVVALWPPPGVPVGGGNYTVLLQVVRNAPVPVLQTDYLQIGPELVNDLLDYAQHLAVFKEGQGQIQATQGLLDQFMTLCGTTLSIQYASQPEEKANVNQTPQDAQALAYKA